MEKKLVAVLLALVMLLSVSALADELRSLPEDETIVIKVLEGVNSNKPDNLVEKAVQERLNVKLEYTYVPSSGFSDKLSNVLASGELPDIVFFLWAKNPPLAWIEQGAILRLDDPENNLLEKYGQNYLSFFEDDAMKPYMIDYDGGIYSVKSITAFHYQSSLMIRSDWLEALNLEYPTTVEDYVEVLRHFKNDDPNGNGMQDEIPYMGLTGDLSPFWNAFGILPLGSNPYVLVDGKLVPRYEHPEFKNCVDLLRELYAEGLIDQEYTVRDIPSRDELVSTDKVGVISATGNESTKLTKSLRANGFDKAMMQPVLPMVGVGGQNIAGRFPTGTCAGITTTAKDPEACMMVLDYLLSEEGQILTNYGVEGETFEYVDGKPHMLSPYCDSWENARGVGIAKGTWVEYWSGDNFLQITFQGKTLDDLDEVDALAYHGYVDSAPYAYSQLPSSIFDTETNRKISADIWAPLNDETNNYIMGLTDWESFENLYKELKEYGLDQITAEVNENYAAMQ